jgi:multiple sugar transport system substrate-binding protein
MVSCSNHKDTEITQNQDGTEITEPSGEEYSKVLTVSSFSDNYFLEQYAAAFQEQHPEVLIKFDVFNESIQELISEETISDSADESETISRSVGRSNPDEDLQPDKYVLKMSTDLMSGQGGDILDLSGLPSAKYADSNYLVDLYELFDNDSAMSLDEYYTNVFKAYEYKEKLYQIPLGFSYINFGISNTYSTEDIMQEKNYWDYNMMFDLYDQADDHYNGLYLNYTLPGLFIREYNTLFNVQDKTCNINSDRFIQMLIRAAECLPAGFDPDAVMIGSSEKIDMSDKLFIALLFPAQIYQYKDFYEKEFTNVQPLLNSDGKIVLSAYERLAINNNSKEKELSWEFIKFCLSDQIQQEIAKVPLVNGFGAFPVKKSVFEAVFAKDAYMEEELYNEIKEWNDSEFTANLADAVIGKMFEDEIKSFLLGFQTAEQTAENLQNKVSTYLNE